MSLDAIVSESVEAAKGYAADERRDARVRAASAPAQVADYPASVRDLNTHQRRALATMRACDLERAGWRRRDAILASQVDDIETLAPYLTKVRAARANASADRAAHAALDDIVASVR